MGADSAEVLKSVLAGLWILWLIFVPVARPSREGEPRRSNWRVGVLAGLALIGVLNWAGWGNWRFVLFQRLATYDVLHYYLGAKYFPELRYRDLYPAMIVADHDNGPSPFVAPAFYMVQRGEKYVPRPVSTVIVRAARVRARFSPARWAEFTHDFLFLRRSFGPDYPDWWAVILQDHGYNGPPAWALVAGKLANLVPVESVKLLCYVDLLLLCVAVATAWRVFGATVGLSLVMFLAVSYSTRWPMIGSTLLRFDWVACLILAVSLIRARRFWLGGAAIGWAAASRLFPVLWLYGAVIHCLTRLRGQRTRDGVRVLAGAVLVAGLANVAVIARWGTWPITAHYTRMNAYHSVAYVHEKFIGFPVVLAFNPWSAGPSISPEDRARMEDQKFLAQAAGTAFVLVFAALLARASVPLWEAAAYGAVPLFFLMASTSWYGLGRITLVLAHSAQLDKGRHRVGLAMLLLPEVFASAYRQAGTRWWLMMVFCSWLLLAYAVVQAGWLFLESHERTQAGTA